MSVIFSCYLWYISIVLRDNMIARWWLFFRAVFSFVSVGICYKNNTCWIGGKLLYFICQFFCNWNFIFSKGLVVHFVLYDNIKKFCVLVKELFFASMEQSGRWVDKLGGYVWKEAIMIYSYLKECGPIGFLEGWFGFNFWICEYALN